jgi:RND superfamily putative drug exporter
MRLERFARVMYRRRRIVLAAWIVAVISLTVGASTFGGEHRADYGIPGSESAAAATLMSDRLPERSGDLVQLVVHAPFGVDLEPTARRITDVIDRVEDVEHVRGVQQPAVSPDGTILLANVQLDDTVEKVPLESIEQLIALAADARADGLQVEVGGLAVQNAEGSEAGSEQIGMLLALVILLLAFGSLLAAGLPLLIAVAGLGVALALGEFLNHVFIVPDWAPQLVTMIGIGVGIDYALFVVVRFRSALAAGADTESAVVQALSTAGRAVLFAGGTVVISLLGLCAMGMTYLYGTAAVTVTGVLVVLVASMTLLPALLGFVGTNVDRLRLPWVRGGDQTDGMWYRWSRVVQRRPIATGAVALAALVALAVPFTDLRFGYPDGGSGDSSLTSRRAYDLVAEGFGPGANGPLVVAVDAGQEGAAIVDDVADTVAAHPDVAAVMPPVFSTDGRAAALLVLPVTGPQDAATVETVHALRDVVAGSVDGTTAHAFVGGATASYIDESEYLGARLPYFIGAVIVLAFILLLVVFRSLLVAVKAAVMNLLAIGAAYGVMAIALRGGWFGELIGVAEPTPIPVWAPMMMFALLFGLSMDYEVFLLSRIREEYDRHGDNAEAVADGLAKTGRVISAAAAIMVTVFAAFMLADSVLVKVIGLGLAVSVALDATLVRMVLVPSTMELLGDRNWWLPGWLDRLLPRVSIETHDEPTAGASAGAPSPLLFSPRLDDADSFERELVSSGR